MKPNHFLFTRQALAGGLALGILALAALTAQAVAALEADGAIYLPVVFRNWGAISPTPTAGRLLISEVLPDPVADEPAGEWIELYNPGGETIDLTGYKLGDAAAPGQREGMMQFPAGAALAPGQVIVIANRAQAFFAVYGFNPDYELNESDLAVPNLVKYSAWANYNVELTNGGDEVLALDAADQVVDALSWGSSTVFMDPPAPTVAAGHSLERWPANGDSGTASDWRKQENPAPAQIDLTPPTPQATSTYTITPTPTGGPTQTQTLTPTPTATPTPFSGRLLLSEVLYDPLGDEPEAEWIEIYNADSLALPLDSFKIGDEETRDQGEGMYLFPPGAAIVPGEALAIAHHADAFLAAYGFLPDFELGDSLAEVPDLIKYKSWASGSLNLSNTGDEVLLLDWRDEVIDAVSWGNSTWAFDPAVPNVPAGHSIERYPPGVDTDTAADWRDQPEPVPGEIDLTPPTPTPLPTETQTVTPTPTDTPTPTITPTPTPLPPLVINEIHADPHATEGDANGDGIVDSYDDEFVEIVNTTQDAIDLSSWMLYDEVGLKHTFPVSSVLPANSAVVIFGGGEISGTFGGSLVMTATMGSLSLNNSGDTVTLYDPGASASISYTYGSEGGDDQSLTRAPDVTGPDPLVKHLTAPGSDGRRFSPGTRVDGAPFAGPRAGPAGAFSQRWFASLSGTPFWLAIGGCGLVLGAVAFRMTLPSAENRRLLGKKPVKRV
jgi:hypothetical protein